MVSGLYPNPSLLGLRPPSYLASALIPHPHSLYLIRPLDPIPFPQIRNASERLKSSKGSCSPIINNAISQTSDLRSNQFNVVDWYAFILPDRKISSLHLPPFEGPEPV